MTAGYNNLNYLGNTALSGLPTTYYSLGMGGGFGTGTLSSMGSVGFGLGFTDPLLSLGMMPGYGGYGGIGLGSMYGSPYASNYSQSASLGNPYLSNGLGMGFGVSGLGASNYGYGINNYGSSGLNMGMGLNTGSMVPGVSSYVGAGGNILGNVVPNMSMKARTLDSIFPQGTHLLLKDLQNWTINVLCLRMPDDQAQITYESQTVSAENFDQYKIFCKELKDLVTEAHNVSAGKIFKESVKRAVGGVELDPEVACLSTAIKYMLWLRYWLNTKDVRYETQTPGTPLGYQSGTQAGASIGNPLVTGGQVNNWGQPQVLSTNQALGQVGAQVVTGTTTGNQDGQRSAQMVIKALIRGDESSASLTDNVNVANFMWEIFDEAFRHIKVIIDEETKGIDNTAEDRRSHLSVLASLFLDMPELYQNLCKGANITTNLFDKGKKEAKQYSKLDKKPSLSTREAILGAIALCPNKGAYLDTSKVDAGNRQRRSIIGIYSSPSTTGDVGTCLESINEARALLVGGHLSGITEILDKKSNAERVVDRLTTAIDMLNKIIANEGLANDWLGVRLNPQAGVAAKLPDTELENFLRAEHFLALFWSIAYWILINMTYDVNSKFNDFAQFNERQKKMVVMLTKFCASSDAFLVNVLTSQASIKLGVMKKDLPMLLDEVLLAVIMHTLEVFESGVIQDKPEDRIYFMDLFQTMIQKSSSSKGPWPERVEGVFKKAKEKLPKVFKEKLMDYIDGGEFIPNTVMVNRISRDSGVLSKFLEIVKALEEKGWYKMIFSSTLRADISKKVMRVTAKLRTLPPPQAMVTQSAMTSKVSSGTQATSMPMAFL